MDLTVYFLYYNIPAGKMHYLFFSFSKFCLILHILYLIIAQTEKLWYTTQNQENPRCIMSEHNFREFPVDNASILFLSLIRPYHTNNFRFCAVLRNPICPDALQQAVDRIHPRYPSVIAGFRQDFTHYRQVAATTSPKVQPDPGLLKPMTQEELRSCCFRVYYSDCTISIELFHALTDGAGAIAVLTALVGEYLKIFCPGEIKQEPLGEPVECEVVDSFLDFAATSSKRLPSRFSYLPPRTEDADWQVRGSSLHLKTRDLLDAAHRYGVTLNTLLTAVMAQSVMQLQTSQQDNKKLKPVRLMVPINLRKMAKSQTLRNFSLYSLPTLEPEQRDLSLQETCDLMAQQLTHQLSPEFQSALVANNVKIQGNWLFRMLPWKLKSGAMRLGYHFFGESNSSLTLTNLGIVRLPENIAPHVVDFQCWMTPRVSSPYGCTILSFGDTVALNISRFCPEDQLGEVFFRNLQAIVSET